jgi:hypothetical protein
MNISLYSGILLYSLYFTTLMKIFDWPIYIGSKVLRAESGNMMRVDFNIYVI